MGETLLGEATAAPWEISWEISGLDEGNYVLRARARDEAGNLATSQPVTVYVEHPEPPATEPPDPDPDDGRDPPHSPVTFAGWVEMILEPDSSGSALRIRARTELDGVEQLRLRIDGAEVAGSPGVILDYLWNTAGLLGFHEIHVSGLDAAGGVRAASSVWQVEVDPGNAQGPGRRVGQQSAPEPRSAAVLAISPGPEPGLWHIEAASNLDDIWSMELLVDGEVVADSRRGKVIALDWSLPPGPHDLTLVAYDRTGVRALASARWD
jgi:hypothetical protein